MNDPARKIQFCKSVTAIALMAMASACATPKPPAAKLRSAPLPITTHAVPSPAEALAPTPATTANIDAPDTASRTLSRSLWSELPGWRQDNHAEALPALLASCRVLSKQAAWHEVCEAALSVKGRDAARLFFESHFTPYRVAGTDGAIDGLITGYFEPTLRGSRKPSARNRYPVYGTPDDMLVLDLGELAPELKSTAPRVRLEGKRVSRR